MCINCALDGMLGDMPENPNPQVDRQYPTGWDLAGFSSPAPLGGLVGSTHDDTARIVYSEPELALAHMMTAQAFTGRPMEFFYDGQFYCYRPAIVRDGVVQPPAWHVMRDPEGAELAEEDEIATITAFAEFLRDQGIDPGNILEMPDPDED